MVVMEMVALQPAPAGGAQRAAHKPSPGSPVPPHPYHLYQFLACSHERTSTRCVDLGAYEAALVCVLSMTGWAAAYLLLLFCRTKCCRT